MLALVPLRDDLIGLSLRFVRSDEMPMRLGENDGTDRNRTLRTGLWGRRSFIYACAVN